MLCCGFFCAGIVFIVMEREKETQWVVGFLSFAMLYPSVSTATAAANAILNASKWMVNRFSPEVECRCYYCHRCRMKSHKGYIIHSFIFPYASSSSFVLWFLFFGRSHNTFDESPVASARLLVFVFCRCCVAVYLVFALLSFIRWLIWCSWVLRLFVSFSSNCKQWIMARYSDIDMLRGMCVLCCHIASRAFNLLRLKCTRFISLYVSLLCFVLCSFLCLILFSVVHFCPSSLSHLRHGEKKNCTAKKSYAFETVWIKWKLTTSLVYIQFYAHRMEFFSIWFVWSNWFCVCARDYKRRLCDDELHRSRKDRLTE